LFSLLLCKHYEMKFKYLLLFLFQSWDECSHHA
jgi:hypothetical protein